jgi:hypothetical protein
MRRQLPHQYFQDGGTRESLPAAPKKWSPLRYHSLSEKEAIT